jgi:predicted enzyme related to lactoylglutathione lyase
VSELKGKNVPFTSGEVMEAPVCRMAFIRDPDGNSITLHDLK